MNASEYGEKRFEKTVRFIKIMESAGFRVRKENDCYIFEKFIIDDEGIFRSNEIYYCPFCGAKIYAGETKRINVDQIKQVQPKKKGFFRS